MTGIDRKEAAAAALSEIETIAHRVRQSRFYRLASLMLVLWGALTFAGYVATWLWPRQAGIAWIAVYVAGIAGSFAISALGRARSGVSTFDLRSFGALVTFLGFGFLWSSGLAHFTPRQLGVFWPTYFMMVYVIVGLWVGPAFVAIGLLISALTLVGYLLAGDWFELWMAVVNGGGLVLGRPVDAPELTMDELDEIIHQPLRLKIMAALNALPTAQGLEFARLKKLTGATDGNLGAHIETLARAGYVAVQKAFVGKKPQTTVFATATGRGAFARHVATLRDIIAGSGPPPGG